LAVGRGWLLGASVVVLGVALAFLGYALYPSHKAHAPSLGPVAGLRPVAGFGQVAFHVGGSAVPAAMSRQRRCALLANTEPERDRGLMNRRDLGGYDGMIFQFPHAGRVAFYMKDTLIPLSIAWFDPSGRFVSATDMVPCPPGEDCPLYYPAWAATTAIEVERGHLPSLGIGPGATISVGGACVP
jgi:uncharacterized membrane protein (UPF0127 family)